MFKVLMHLTDAMLQVDADPTCTVAKHLKHGIKNLIQWIGLLPVYHSLTEPTHHQALNVDSVALSSLIVHFHCYPFPLGFYVFIPAAPLGSLCH